MSTSFSKREEIIAAIKRCAEKLGRAPSQAEFRRESKISWHQVYRNFRGMRAAVRAAGLEPGPRGSALDINTLTLDWARVVRKLGRLPSRAEYCEHGVHHAGTLHARIVWSQMSHKFVLTVKEFHLELEWADVVQIVVGKFPLLERSTQQSALSIQPREENKQTYHGDTETRRTAEIECASAPMMVIEREPHRELTRIGTNGTEGPPRAQMTTEAAGLESLPLIAANNTDRQQGGMRLGKVVVADLAIEILMAAGRSTQQSAFSNQPEQGNWQSANRNWQKPFTAKDAHPPHQAKPGLAGGPGDAKEEERETNHVEIERVPLIATDNTEKDAEGLMDMHRASAGGQAPCGRPVVYGEPLGLAAMAHAPTNELGVL
ncbi:MAG TPA: hypothetical protein VH724_03590, partial [Candidatus Angelobacter sp.]|nr:hypothetical protein [Candidatus Angelobacter sp.]